MAGVSILIITMVLGGIAIEEVGGIDTGYLHPILGFIMFIVSILIVFGGFVAKYTMVTLKWKTKNLLFNKLGHKIFAYLVLTLGQITILFGVLKFTSFYGLSDILGIIHMLVFALGFGICETIY